MGKNNPPCASKYKDQISELGNDALYVIQKFLPIREAMSTSQLSTRFKNLWKSCPYLILNANLVLEQDSNSLRQSDKLHEQDFMEKRAEKFVKKLDKFIQYHDGKGIKLFDINFTLSDEYGDSIDEWVKFSINSDTKELTLNLTEGLVPIKNAYRFPHRYFNGTTGKKFRLKKLTLVACKFNVQNNCTDLSSIETLDLVSVKLSEGNIANILSMCTELKWLRLNYCTGLVNLVISHEKLNYLRVGCDRELESIRVQDCAGLSMFEYSACRCYLLDVEFICVPKLSNVSVFSDDDTENLLNGPLTSLGGSLEKLYLELNSPSGVTNEPNLCYSFAYLKNLVLSIKTPRSTSFHWLISLLKATPFVEKIHFEIRTIGKPLTKKPQKIPIEDWPFIYLKSIKIGGFKTDPKQIELIMYLVKNAPVLEYLIVDTRCHLYLGGDEWEKVKMATNTQLETNNEVRREDARAKAERVISEKIPSTMKLNVY